MMYSSLLLLFSAMLVASVESSTTSSEVQKPVMLQRWDQHRSKTQDNGSENRLLQNIPDPTSFEEFCRNYSLYYLDAGYDGCECLQEYWAHKCWFQYDEGEFPFETTVHVFDAERGLPLGGAVCFCREGDCSSKHLCQYIYDPMGIPTCVEEFVNPEGIDGWTCRQCKVCLPEESHYGSLGVDTDQCHEAFDFGCTDTFLFSLGAAEVLAAVPLDHIPQPFSVPPIGIPTTPAPTAAPTPEPTRTGTDLLSLAVDDPGLALYDRNPEVAACNVKDDAFDRQSIECTFLQEHCNLLGACGPIEQAWTFQSVIGKLVTQGTCYDHSNVCFYVIYNNTGPQSTPIWCNVQDQLNGETCECQICESSDGRTGVNADECDTYGLDMNGCFVDHYIAATPGGTRASSRGYRAGILLVQPLAIVSVVLTLSDFI